MKKIIIALVFCAFIICIYVNIDPIYYFFALQFEFPNYVSEPYFGIDILRYNSTHSNYHVWFSKFGRLVYLYSNQY